MFYLILEHLQYSAKLCYNNLKNFSWAPLAPEPRTLPWNVGHHSSLCGHLISGLNRVSTLQVNQTQALHQAFLSYMIRPCRETVIIPISPRTECEGGISPRAAELHTMSATCCSFVQYSKALTAAFLCSIYYFQGDYIENGGRYGITLRVAARLKEIQELGTVLAYSEHECKFAITTLVLFVSLIINQLEHNWHFGTLCAHRHYIKELLLLIQYTHS